MPNVVCFLVDRPFGLDIDESVDRTPWEQVAIQQNRNSQELFTKVMVPGSEAKALLGCLHGLGIDAATMFPGYSGAVRALRERSFYPFIHLG
jgi:hypothetical protein